MQFRPYPFQEVRVSIVVIPGSLAKKSEVTTLATVVICVLSMPLGTFAQGRIIGNIDGVAFDGASGVIWGWACQQGQEQSITVHVFADDRFLIAGQANQSSEPAIGQACQDKSGKHRFRIQLPTGPFADRQERSLRVNGIRVVGSVENSAIRGSGTTRFRLPQIPGVAGSYTSASEHPRVFISRGELEKLASRINARGSYSADRFTALAVQVGRDLVSGKRWNAAYSGCNSEAYTYAFSYEPQGGEQSLKVQELMALAPNAKPPSGAAVVAARLALYAALIKAGAAPAKAGAPSPEQAATLAKEILLAWSSHGFRDDHGNFLSTPSQFCTVEGKFNDSAFVGAGLVVSRGIIYSLQAEDMLLYLGDLNDAEQKQVTAFDSAMFTLLLNALNYNFSEHHAWPCDHYSNHAANQLAGLLALARALDKPREFGAVLDGKDSSIHVTLPWVMFFQRAIYGGGDAPNGCYANTGPDGSTSRPFFQTSTVAPGEIDDRYRNDSPGKGIGYAMFTLERLYDAAEVLRNAGFDPYGYRGYHKQSLEMATAYYACFAKSAGFNRTITAENHDSCADAAQYIGQIVNGVDRMVLIGALRFPNNNSITSVEAAAKKIASSGVFSLDPILFGRWRD